MPAEQRLLSIFVCDIVGSTAYAETLDPEDFELLLQNFFDSSSDLVTRNNGSIANHIGDGFVAYFGFPRADGIDVQHAIDCGLEIVGWLESLEPDDPRRLRVRIGIATGHVILSNIKGQSGDGQAVAFGKTAHLAARLQSIADPNSVFVDDSSHALAMQNFVFSDVGEHSLKGFEKPSRVWRVEGRRDLQLRFEERLTRLSPLVGRGNELNLVFERWHWSKAGDGQAVVLQGEPGIGKSRVVFEAGRHLEESGARIVVFQCQETFENTPFHPLLQQLERMSGIGSRDAISVRREKMNAILGSYMALTEDLRTVVLSLMAYPVEDGVLDDDSTPERKLQALYDAIIELAIQIAMDRPLVVIVEDAQWIDPTSKTLLDLLIERIEGARILVLITVRSGEFVARDCQNLTQVSLDRLTKGEVRTLAKTVMKGSDISNGLVDEIVTRSDGIPLYVEEIAQSVADNIGNQTGQDSIEPADAKSRPHSLPIPDSLQGSLLSRLDQLGDTRELAQIAAVIGREFDCEVLAKLADRDDRSVDRDLDTLTESGVFYRRYDSTRRMLSFKHTLIREAAYQSLLRRDAIVFHKRLARIYEDDFPDMKDMHPEILAYHYTMSELWAAAAKFWLRAGLAARDVGSNVEAKNRLEQGLAALDRLKQSRATRALRMKLQLARGEVINAQYGPAMAGAHEALRESARIGEEIGDTESTVAAQTSLFTLEYVLGALPDAEAVATKLVERGRSSDDDRTTAIGLLGSGMCRFAMGNFVEAQQRLEASLGYLESDLKTATGYPSKAFIYLSLIRHIFGSPEEAVALCGQGVDAAREQRAIDLSAALGNSLYLHRMQNRVDRATAVCQELMDLTERKGFKMWYYQGRFFLGWVRAKEGDESGLAMMEEAMARFRRAEELIEQSFFFGIMAERYLALGHAEQGLRMVELGFDIVKRCDERFFEAPLCVLKARCLERLACPADKTEVDRLIGLATSIADRQGAVAWRPTETL